VGMVLGIEERKGKEGKEVCDGLECGFLRNVEFMVRFWWDVEFIGRKEKGKRVGPNRSASVMSRSALFFGVGGGVDGSGDFGWARREKATGDEGRSRTVGGKR